MHVTEYTDLSTVIKNKYKVVLLILLTLLLLIHTFTPLHFGGKHNHFYSTTFTVLIDINTF